MLDLSRNIIDESGVIAYDDYFLYYHEVEHDYWINYIVLDSDLRVICRDNYCYGEFNPATRMYDIDVSDKVTLGELLGFINEDSNFEFDENGIQLKNDDLVMAFEDLIFNPFV